MFGNFCSHEKCTYKVFNKQGFITGKSELTVTNIFSFFQIEDEMIQCIICEDWYHGRVGLKRHIVIGKNKIGHVLNPYQYQVINYWPINTPCHS